MQHVLCETDKKDSRRNHLVSPLDSPPPTHPLPAAVMAELPDITALRSRLLLLRFCPRLLCLFSHSFHLLFFPVCLLFVFVSWLEPVPTVPRSVLCSSALRQHFLGLGLEPRGVHRCFLGPVAVILPIISSSASVFNRLPWSYECFIPRAARRRMWGGGIVVLYAARSKPVVMGYGSVWYQCLGEGSAGNGSTAPASRAKSKVGRGWRPCFTLGIFALLLWCSSRLLLPL